MLTLSLLRHAKSSRSDPDLDDFDRPLAARGLRDAPEMGKRLAAHDVHPDMVVTSPARRAAQTARLIALEIGYPARDLRSDDRIYLAGMRDLLKIVQTIDDGLSHVMLVGHNPSFTELANRLTEAGIDNIPTCGYVAIQFPFDHWRQVTPASGRVVHFNFPKNTGKSAFVPPAFRNPE